MTLLNRHITEIPILSLVVFMTCNNINKITPALLRPGRIDVKLNFDYAMPEQVRDTFWRFMGLDEETSAPLSEEERAIAETHVEKFEKMIPASTVTTAEVQGYFIDILLEANAESWTRDRIYEAMFERIPEFLEKVERDRKQAEEHRQASKKASAEKASADKKEETEKEEEKSNELEW
jgi:SpoVK/Ycf46/Vps4 family AAA+-type ATPase